MAKISSDKASVNARIVYWGIPGAGKSTNLRIAHARMRPDHRGELREEASRIDPSVGYEVLPITLGEVGGIRTQIELVAAPGAPEQAPMRRQLLDEVDGVVMVVDASASADENRASFEELRDALGSYGRKLSGVPFVVQYNKRDLVDPYALEDLHRKLSLGDVSVFEGVATEGAGVLQALSTISKRVVRLLREQGVEPHLQAEPEAKPEPEPVGEPEPGAPEAAPRTALGRMQLAVAEAGVEPDADALDATVSAAESLLDHGALETTGEIARPQGVRLGPDVSIVSVGDAARVGSRGVRIPLVLGDAEGGASTLVLTLQLDPVLEDGGDG